MNAHIIFRIAQDTCIPLQDQTYEIPLFSPNLKFPRETLALICTAVCTSPFFFNYISDPSRRLNLHSTWKQFPMIFAKPRWTWGRASFLLSNASLTWVFTTAPRKQLGRIAGMSITNPSLTKPERDCPGHWIHKGVRSTLDAPNPQKDKDLKK